MKNVIVISGLVAALATGGSIAQAKPRPEGGPDRAPHDQGKNRGHGKGHGKDRGKGHGQAKRCAKERNVGFVVKGTFVAGDATSVTLRVTKANRHALKSGLVSVGDDYTATPTDGSRIKYVNRTGAEDAQATDKVKVIGKVTALKRKCSSGSFRPAATVRKVKVVAADPTPEATND